MEQKSTFTVQENGGVRFTYNGKECILTPEVLRNSQKMARERITCDEGIKKLESALEQLTDNAEASDLIKEKIGELKESKEKIRKQQTDYLKSHGTPSTRISDSMNNEIMTPVLSFFEAYFKKKAEAKAIYTDIMISDIGEDFYEALRENQPVKLLGCMERQGAEIVRYQGNEENDRMVMLAQRDGEWSAAVFSSENEAKEHIKRNYIDPGINPEKTIFYSINSQNLTEELKNRLMSEKNKKEVMDNASGSKCVATFENKRETEKIEKKETPHMIEDYNTQTRTALLRYAETDSMRKAIERTDFTPLAARGVTLWNESEESLRKMANGGTTGMIGEIYRNEEGKVVKGECKIKIYKTENGYRCGIYERHSRPQIPQKIGGHTLTPSEIKMIKEKGSLKSPIRVEMNGREMLLMPYLDRETNHVFMRDMRRLAIDKNYKKAEINKDIRERLIHGEVVKMNNLTDKQGQLYTGYVKINPMTGKIEEYVKPSADYERQVRANNHGERTSDLQNDKDTVLKSGQQRNDDPKPERTITDTDKTNKKITKKTFRPKIG